MLHRGISQQRWALPACLAAALLLAACSSGEGERSPAVPAAPATYPDLARVPERPRLGYSVEQRREIAAGLVADRANARYRAGELAFATGRAETPPAPPSPPAPTAAAALPAAAPAPPPAGDAKLARAYVDASLKAASDEDELDDFVDLLDRKIPDPAGPRSVAQIVGLAPPPAPPAAAESEEPRGLAAFGAYLGGLLGLDEPPAAQP